MAVGTSRLSLLLDPALLDRSKALVGQRPKNPDVPWSTLTEMVAWGLQQAPEEVERRRIARMQEEAVRRLAPASNRIELPFHVYFRSTDAKAKPPFSRGVPGVEMSLPPDPAALLREITDGLFHRAGVVQLECPACPILSRFLGVRVEAKSGAPVEVRVQELRHGEPVPSPVPGVVTLVYLDVGGSPNVLDRQVTAAHLNTAPNEALLYEMRNPPTGTTYALAYTPILMAPNDARLDLVVHPDDGPLRVFLLVERLR